MKFLKDEIIDKDTVSFILGLVYFADWDDYDRESYLWSQTSVIKMIRKPLEWKTWRNQILSHPSYPLINNLFKESRSKYYCFFLCVNLLSLEDEINNFISILQPVIQPSDPHSIPPDSLPLTPPQTILLNLLRDIRNLTPNGLNSTFRRTSCRVGSQYQADIVSISSAPTPTSTTEVSELIYHPNHSLSDLEIAIYLTSAQKIIPIQCGYLLDAVKPTISAAEMDTSLIPPEIHDDESHDSFQSKIVSYNNRLKYLTQTQKLKRGVGMSQTNSGNQLLISKTLDNSFSSSVNLSSNDLSQSSISSVSPQPLNLHSTPALLFKSHDPNPYLVPISDCRQRFCWDDALLEILHHSNYSTQSALLKLHQLASSYDSHGSSNLSVYYNMNRWSKDALHIFFQTLR